MQLFSIESARSLPVLFAFSASLVLLAPAEARATDFEVEEWSVIWQDPDLDGIPSPIALFNDFEDGIFDGAPQPDCFTLQTRYCEISGEVLSRDNLFYLRADPASYRRLTSGP